MSGTPIGDDDIRAFGPPPAAVGPDAGSKAAPPRRRRRWPWVVAGAVLVLLLLLAAILALAIPLAAGLAELAREVHAGWDITINGERIVLPELGEGGWLLVALAVGLAMTIALVVVPLTIGAIGAGLLGAALAVGLALLAVLLVLAVVLAPLGLLIWLLWRALRRPPGPGAAARATTGR